MSKHFVTCWFPVIWGIVVIITWNVAMMTISHARVSLGSRQPVELTSQQQEEINRFVEEVRNCRHVPGLALTVATNQHVLLQRGFGKADIEHDVDVTTKTLFPIGSVTKGFTAALLALLLDRSNNRYDWDTPIKKIIGCDFELYDKTLTEQTTLRDLLSHRTGLPGYFVALLKGPPFNEITTEKLIKSLRYHRPDYPLRTHFLYNNFMYLLAGYVAEVLGQDSWQKLIQKEIFRPLNMSSSDFIANIAGNIENNNMAKAYTFTNNQLTQVDYELLHQVDAAEPAGAIVSTVEDMAKWIQFLLRRGSSPSNVTIIAGNILDEIYKPVMPLTSPMNDYDLHKPTFPVLDVENAYGLGWITGYYRGYKRHSHSGGLSTYISRIWLYPDVGVGIYVSTNGPRSPNGSLAQVLVLRYLSDLLLGYPAWLNISTACTFPQPWTNQSSHDVGSQECLEEPHVCEKILPDCSNESNPCPSETRSSRHPTEYIGTYVNPGFGKIMITFNESDNKLYLFMGKFIQAKLIYGKIKDGFIAQLVGRYWFTEDRIPVYFTESEAGGDINALEMPLYAPYMTVSRTLFVRNGWATKRKPRYDVNEVSECGGINFAVDYHLHDCCLYYNYFTFIFICVFKFL